MVTFRQLENFTLKWMRNLLQLMLFGSAMTMVACARHVWSDQSERFRIERLALFFDKKTEVVERNVRDLDPQQLEELKALRWTDEARCTEDVAFFYTLTIYDRDGKENIFHAPDWNCGPVEQKRYIKEEPLFKFFRSLNKESVVPIGATAARHNLKIVTASVKDFICWGDVGNPYALAAINLD